MDINLTIILIVMGVIILWLFSPLFGNKKSDTDSLDPKDSLLIENYQKKTELREKSSFSYRGSSRRQSSYIFDTKYIDSGHQDRFHRTHLS